MFPVLQGKTLYSSCLGVFRGRLSTSKSSYVKAFFCVQLLVDLYPALTGLCALMARPVYWTVRGVTASWTAPTTVTRTTAPVGPKHSYPDRIVLMHFHFEAFGILTAVRHCHLVVGCLYVRLWFKHNPYKIYLPVDTLAYKVQNLQWTPDFMGAITLTWSRPKNLPVDSCYFLIYYR